MQVDVNGPDASEVFKLLKVETGTQDQQITWNFGTYWIVDPSGAVTRHDGVSPEELDSGLAAMLR